jgi:hypothetical protein
MKQILLAAKLLTAVFIGGDLKKRVEPAQNALAVCTLDRYEWAAFL